MIKKKYFILWLGEWKLSLINIQVGELNEVETDTKLWAPNFLRVIYLLIEVFSL